MTNQPTMRTIRSFVKREGRLTRGQERAMTVLWPKYGIAYDAGTSIDLPNPLILEIGFGMGHSLCEMARANPQNHYLGVEVHTPGVGTLLMDIEKHDLKNIQVMMHDAVEVIDNMLGNNSLDGVQIFFPDPWHKKRHHKRRLISPEFVGKLAPKIKSGGFIHLATDWENYAEQMMEVLTAAEPFENTQGENQFMPNPGDRPKTKFENRGERLGHGVWDLMFTKK